ncbi:hypothetical protein PNP85_04215 [Halobacterium salinarum]|uniref:hypothetical protein n=1 Tax=Halobacterium salinarum TaxID=2242 RepID=UPI002555645E|nr:hypothetical protein [Halobacterium salinarum]MDL0127638.1 hypothetical protein [Halobacterium salinarum]MDL0135614.1 hypothetical protein [Halobacterium salinarum]MDL0138711.1 hypothetical protein [Halobacterium salinarum]
MTTLRLEHHTEQLLAALAYPLTSAARGFLFVGVSVATYALLILSSFPEYSMQMLGADLGYLDTALVALTANTYATIGTIGLGLIVTYAILTGIAVTNAIGRVAQVGLSGSRGLSSAIPGLLASGCASCGAGVLGLIGFAGALAAMPFHGNLLRIGGLTLLIGHLARAGDPRYCMIDSATEGE